MRYATPVAMIVSQLGRCIIEGTQWVLTWCDPISWRFAMGVLLVCVDHSIHRSAIGRPVDFPIIFIPNEALDCLHSVD